ncbi:heat shock protein HspQ [Pseudochrobactrum sp. MP213Fo]|uniref:heat shock protein HspQ n=1 Tax=Pseudochrobactrum sp. MP213Fo TaxID=3022250 RepID=UPI003BA15EDF
MSDFAIKYARFQIGQVVKHRLLSFRGIIFDVDPEFDNTEEWYMAIPEALRPMREQPFYHVLAESDEADYVAYVSEQNLEADESMEPLRHPMLKDYFDISAQGEYLFIGEPLN